MLRAMASERTSSFDDVRLFDEAQQRAARWLAAWDGQGIHRTATAGDEAGADWLAREAAALDAPRATPTTIQVAIEEFALDRLDPVAAFLEVRGARIDAVPVFDAPTPRSSSSSCRQARSTAVNWSGCAGRAGTAAW
jgi:hypothetical protein